MTARTIIFDSSGLTALFKPDDTLHKDAVEIAKLLEKHDWQVLLPYEVLSETINVIGKLVGRKEAVKVGRALLAQYSGGTIRLLKANSNIILKSVDMLSIAPGSPSYTDCLVMAQAEDQKTAYIFGFDATFNKNGYKLPD